MGRNLFIFLSSIFVVVGCGPSQTARDAEATQRNAFLKRTNGEMAFLEGTWSGSMTLVKTLSMDAEIEAAKNPPGGNTKPPPPPPPPPPGEPIVMQIILTSILTADPAHNEVAESPTLMAVFKTVSAENPIVVFTSGLYNTATNHLQLVSATVPGPTSAVVAPTTMLLEYDGVNLKGRLVAPQRISDVVLKRVQ